MIKEKIPQITLEIYLKFIPLHFEKYVESEKNRHLLNY